MTRAAAPGVDTPTPPSFGGRRLLLVVTGSPGAQGMPQWLMWLTSCYPDLEVQVLVTRSALRFVTLTSLRLRVPGQVHVDTWDDLSDGSHVSLAQWADTVLVYPATLGHLVRVATGTTETPSTLVIQSTSGVVGIAPALPPGAIDSPAFRRAWATLAGWPRVALVPPVPGLSLRTGGFDGSVAPPLTTALARLEQRRQEVASPETPDTTSPGARRLRTGLLHTDIRSEGETVEWRRRPGPEAPAPFASLPASLRVWLEADEPDPVAWAVGVGDHSERRYRAGGSESLAAILLREGPADWMVPLVRGMGARLARLHASAPRAVGGDTAHRGLERLRVWLDGRAPDPEVAQAEDVVRTSLGERATVRLRALCAELDETDDVLVHGAPSLGSLIPDEPVDAVAPTARALVGEDVCLGSWRADLGWLVGELVELRWVRGDDDPHWARLLDALFEGYGKDLGHEWGPLAALRIALHLHDYTAYVRANRDTMQRYAGFITYLVGVADGDAG